MYWAAEKLLIQPSKEHQTTGSRFGTPPRSGFILIMANEKNKITPTALTRSAGCLHSFYLDCFGDRSSRRRESSAERHVKDLGIALQERIVEGLPGVVGDKAEYGSLEEGARLTRQWMEQGVPWIYQGVLLDEQLSGIPDLLMRVPGNSRLGSFSYVPGEVKSHKVPTFYDKLQLFHYASLLESVLGFRPETGFVLAGSLENRHEIRLEGRLERQFTEILRQMQLVQKGEMKTEAFRCSSCSRCLWSSRCHEEWKATDHISLISGLSAVMARKLFDAGIRTCRQLAETSSRGMSELLDVPEKICERFVHAAQARSENRAIILKKPAFPKNKTIYFYDIETNDDQVFCHGIVRVKNGASEERCFFAEAPHDEARIWHELLDYLAVDDDLVVYCWTLYERTYVDICWKKFGGNRKGYDNLNRHLVDQCAFVREHFALPCRGYSIKAVAPFFGFQWTSEEANGMNCVAWYRGWLETQSLELREKIVQYNLDDVRAMAVVDRHLKVLADPRVV